ncbi:hypothetical protein RBU49_06720 [Clostridium sp. MB40-C1]|uniref:hypothetical protein n=1 Tax=Clostridium sp. MB40-C1 TaxID=3070996 RepID=UPI0027E09CC9|nr:hypothetical protein [Clostridium sp. MB40-C1]WMJ81935.1 hypothetical protein RBU49_06720 [Clostridium sp. MB40-C1]
MSNIRNLVGSTLIDVEVNVNGFTVLYFQNQEGEKYSVDLCPTVRKLEKEAAPEVPVQEQYVAKCKYCNEVNSISLPEGIKPEFCMHCGKRINY